MIVGFISKNCINISCHTTYELMLQWIMMSREEMDGCSRDPLTFWTMSHQNTCRPCHISSFFLYKVADIGTFGQLVERNSSIGTSWTGEASDAGCHGPLLRLRMLTLEAWSLTPLSCMLQPPSLAISELILSHNQAWLYNIPVCGSPSGFGMAWTSEGREKSKWGTWFCTLSVQPELTSSPRIEQLVHRMQRICAYHEATFQLRNDMNDIFLTLSQHQPWQEPQIVSWQIFWHSCLVNIQKNSTICDNPTKLWLRLPKPDIHWTSTFTENYYMWSSVGHILTICHVVAQRCTELRAMAGKGQGIYGYLHSAHFLRFLGMEEQVLWNNLSGQSIWPGVYHLVTDM